MRFFFDFSSELAKNGIILTSISLDNEGYTKLLTNWEMFSHNDSGSYKDLQFYGAGGVFKIRNADFDNIKEFFNKEMIEHVPD